MKNLEYYILNINKYTIDTQTPIKIINFLYNNVCELKTNKSILVLIDYELIYS